MSPEEFQNLESGARRPMSEDGVLHPDDCAQMRMMGVVWYVRPLQLPRGIRYTPDFVDGVTFRQTIDPLGNKPMQERAEALLEFLKTEPEDLKPIEAVCEYLSALLDQQYTLADELKAELIAFRGENLPPWFTQAVRHASGLDPQPTFVESLLPPEPEPELEPEPVERPWWKVWG